MVSDHPLFNYRPCNYIEFTEQNTEYRINTFYGLIFVGPSRKFEPLDIYEVNSQNYKFSKNAGFHKRTLLRRY